MTIWPRSSAGIPTNSSDSPTHNPFEPDAVAELERAVTELGLRGYKLLAPMIEQPIEDESIWPVWEKCAELDIPVLIHFGIQGSAGGIAWHENINPFKLHNIAKAFPDVTFVIPPLRLRLGTRDPSTLLGLPQCSALTPAAASSGSAGSRAT